MGMVVGMALRKMEPRAKRHEQSCDEERSCQRCAENDLCGDSADEWSGAIIGAGARRSQMPKRHNEQHKAEPIADKTEHQGGGNTDCVRTASAGSESQRRVDGARDDTLDRTPFTRE